MEVAEHIPVDRHIVNGVAFRGGGRRVAVVSGRQRLLSPADQGKVVMLAILTNNVPSSSAPVRARYQPGAFAEWFPERDPDLDRPHPTDPTQSTENKVSRSRTNQPAASGRAIVMSGGPTDALNPGCMHSPKVFCNGEPASSLKTSMRAGAILPSEIVLGPLTDMRLTVRPKGADHQWREVPPM